MTIRRLAVALMLTIVVVPASLAHGLLKFTVDLRDTKSHLVHVTFIPSGFQARTGVYQMPVWAPGAYSVSHYGRYLTNFKATNKYGHELAVKQLNDDRWQIASGGSVQQIEYDVLDSHKDTTSLYFAMANIDTSIFFANATALFGYYDDDKNATDQVTYLLPDGWKLVCPLDPGKVSRNLNPTDASLTPNFIAKNYDELADAPVVAAPIDLSSTDGSNEVPKHSNRLITASFQEGSAMYDVAVLTDGSWPDAKMDSLSYYLRQIVHAETDFFHDTPFKHYTFEIIAPTLSHLPSFAEGALEHANSSDYLLMDMSWPLFKRSFLPIFSHEFFHLWNVKRIHSTLLGPFDYTKRVLTTSLWMAEGITEYYAHTLLARYGIIGPDRFYEDIAGWRKEMAFAPDSAKNKSLEQLSIDESDFNLDEATLFYTRGPLVALMLDIEIRRQTNNKKSLDDVMRALNNDAKHGKTFREKDLIHTVEKYAGIDLTAFYDHYIHGTDSLPVDTYLTMIGMGKKNPDSASVSHTMVQYGSIDTDIVIQSIDSSYPYAKAGVHDGDILRAINGTKIGPDNLMAQIQNSLPEDSGGIVILSIIRDGVTKDIPVTFPKSPNMNKSLTSKPVDPDAPPLAVEIRKGIVGQ